MKILIADDSGFMRKILRSILEKNLADAEILEAENGEEALEIYAKEKPTLLLLDLIMPEKDGMDVLKEIGSDAGKKIVVVSSMGQEDIIEEAKSLGANDFVVKPFDEHALEVTIQKVIASA